MEKQLEVESFLTRIDFRRFSILKLFEQEHKSSLSVEEISLILGLSERTTKRTILDLQSDIELFGYSEKISLELYIGNNSRLYSSLHYHPSFSLHYILRAYLKKSIFFMIVKDLLFESSFSIKKAIDRYFVTNSTLRRYLKKINTELQVFNLELSIKKEITIVGEEASIRLFYTALFFEVYTGDTWPFSFISQKKVNALLNHFPKSIYSPEENTKRDYFQTFLAVSILRIRKKKQIEHRALYFTGQEDADHQDFLTELNVMKELCPTIPVQQLKNELAFMHSLVLSYGPYTSSTNISYFFIQNSELAKSNFYGTILLGIKNLEGYLYEPLSLKEENDLIYATCLLFYRLRLFNNIELNTDKNWIEESTLDKTFKFQVDLLRGIMTDLTKSLNPFNLSNHYLKFHCIELLFSYVDVRKFMPPITLVIITTFEKSLIRYITNYGDLFHNFNLSVVSDSKTAIDIVVSNRPIMKSNCVYSISEQTNYIFWQDFPTKKNYEDLKELLMLLCRKKLPFDF